MRSILDKLAEFCRNPTDEAGFDLLKDPSLPPQFFRCSAAVVQKRLPTLKLGELLAERGPASSLSMKKDARRLHLRSTHVNKMNSVSQA